MVETGRVSGLKSLRDLRNQHNDRGRLDSVLLTSMRERREKRGSVKK